MQTHYMTVPNCFLLAFLSAVYEESLVLKYIDVLIISDYSFLKNVLHSSLPMVPSQSAQNMETQILPPLIYTSFPQIMIRFLISSWNRLYYWCLNHTVCRGRTEFPWNWYSPHPSINSRCKGTALNDTRYSLNSWLKIKLNTTKVFQSFEIAFNQLFIFCISSFAIPASVKISKYQKLQIPKMYRPILFLWDFNFRVRLCLDRHQVITKMLNWSWIKMWFTCCDQRNHSKFCGHERKRSCSENS